MRKTIVAFGEVLWDLLPSCTVLGGAPFNFTYRADSLGDGGLMVSRLGSDDLGRRAYERIVELGLDTTHIQWDHEFPTGTVQVSFDEHNNPDYVIIPNVAYDQVEIDKALVETAAKADCLCFGTLAQRSETSRRTLRELIKHAVSSLKLLDINLRKDCYTLESVRFSLEHADVLKLNEDEAHRLEKMLDITCSGLDDFCRRILDHWSLKYCVVTLAEKGALAVSVQGDSVYVPGYKVDLIDSLGSGDAFSAGFVHKILRGKSAVEACEFGNVLGALVATQEGATAPLTEESIEQFLNKDWERAIYVGLEQFITN